MKGLMVTGAIKNLIPKVLRSYRKDLILLRKIERHKRMNRSEVEACLREEYKSRVGQTLNLDNPQRYTEKIQWCKLNAMTPIKSRLADKYAVREWITDLIGPDYLIPLLGKWDSPSEIDYEALPEAFVLKATHASGTNIIVQNKGKLNKRVTAAMLNRWLRMDYGWLGFEQQYMRIPPRIIAESFVANDDGSEISDYKVLCFNGEPKFIWVDLDRYANHKRVVFDVNWTRQEWNQYHYPYSAFTPSRPACLDEMIALSRKLSSGFPHVRVDFYIVNGAIKFGEMTFSNGGGMEEIRPLEWDYKLGEMWNLDLEELTSFPCR